MALELCENSGKGIRAIGNRVAALFTRPKIKLEEREVLGGSFGLLRAQLRNHTPDWPALELLAGNFADRLLLPEGLALPPDSRLRALRCPHFEQKILIATACEVVSRTRMPMYRRVLGLLDPAGDCADALPVLLRYYTSVRVVTQALDVYEAAAEALMEELGAPVLVGQSLSSLRDCVLLLAPSGGTCAPDGVACPVLAGGAFDPGIGLCACHVPTRVALPLALEQACPPGISTQRLAGALYEYCGVELSSYTAQRVLHGDRETSLSELVLAVMQNAKILSIL